MSKSLQIVQGATLLLTLAVLCACGSRSEGPQEVPNPESAAAANDPVVQRGAATVKAYIVESKHWPEDRFRVEFQRKEGATLVFWALSADDPRSAPGGGKSVEVHVDPTSNKVVKELGFQ